MKAVLLSFALVLSIIFLSCEKTEDDTDLKNNDTIDTTDNTNDTTDDNDSTSNDTSAFNESFFKVFGAPGNNDDELTSGMVIDASGVSYISMNIYLDIVVCAINPDGSLKWAKKWDAGFLDKSPDSGENAETGGTANSISLDSEGNLYLAVSASDVTQGNIFMATIIKLNPQDGSVAWQKAWRHKWPSTGSSPVASMDAMAYAVDATGDYVYMTGTNGDNMVILLALNKADGSMYYQRAIDIVSGTKDRGYCIKTDKAGNVYIGGVSGSYAYLSKIESANTLTPSLTWVKKIDIGYGGRINGIDIDNDNNIYLSCDRRGAQTYFSVIKVSPDCNVLWGLTYPGNNEDRNNTHVVKVIGDYVYAGGRTGQADLDKELGDGLLLKIKKADGSLLKAGYYFSGLASDAKAEHRIKGIASYGNKLYVAGQVYTSSYNSDHYYGEWLNGENEPEVFSPSTSAFASASMNTPADGSVKDASGTISDAGSSYVCQDGTAKNNGTPPDGDAFLMAIDF